MTQKVQLDSIKFQVEVGQDSAHTTGSVTPVISGISLIDLAREVELPSAHADGQPELAGSYAGWTIDTRERWPDEFLNRGQDSWFDEGDTSVLGCKCGSAGCWDLTTIITINDDTITWGNFRMGHRDWDLSALGPFTFSRTQYLRALSDASGIPVNEFLE